MLLLHPDRTFSPPAERRSPPVVLFGVGLLGSAIRDALVREHYRAELLPLSWEDPRLQQRQLHTIESRLDAAIRGSEAIGVDFVWAAGKAGFGSAKSETAPELDSFRAILTLAESAATRRGARTTGFHLLSSIGGLFEGQRFVERDSAARALRPYAHLKMRQEDLLAASRAPLCRRIYRLTSVFGPAPAGRRRGLIPTLIHNGQRHLVTRIVGRLSTLRDFVWTEDIGRYLRGRLLAPNREQGIRIHTLAAGRPSSIREILNLVEGLLQRRLYVQFDLGLSNSMDITVSPAILAARWCPSDLKTAVRQVWLSTTRF